MEVMFNKMREITVSEPILYADDLRQVYLIKSDEDITLKQLEGVKDLNTQLVVNTNEPIIGQISGCKDTNIFISIVNMPVLIENETQIKVDIYNNSYFKGISIKKGEVLGTLII